MFMRFSKVSALCIALFSVGTVGVYAQCNTINGVTGATFSIQSGGKACTDTAVVVWRLSDNSHPYSTVDFQWGTVNGTYPNKVSLLPTTKNVNHSTTIKNLTPSTTFYGDVALRSSSTEFNKDIKFSFTTTAKATGIISNQFNTSYKDLPANYTTTLYDLNGKVLTTRSSKDPTNNYFCKSTAVAVTRDKHTGNVVMTHKTLIQN